MYIYIYTITCIYTWFDDVFVASLFASFCPNSQEYRGYPTAAAFFDFQNEARGTVRWGLKSAAVKT